MMKSNLSFGDRITSFLSRYFDLIFCIVIFFTLLIFFSFYAAGPKGSDELLYADIGLRGYENYIVMNRYTHIFLQMIFMFLAKTPLNGMKIFWGFVMSMSSILVYLLGKNILKTNNAIHGFFALLIFLSMNIFRRYFGIPIVDLTTMMMFLIYLLVFLFYIRKGRRRWIVILLGLVFFLAFKNKEFSIILLLTLPAFGIDDSGRFHWKQFLNGCLHFLIGILSSVVLFVVLNGIFLSDPWFGLRISDWVLFRNTISSFTNINPNPDSYLLTIIWSAYSLSFTLYLLSFSKRAKKITLKEKLVWILPLIYITMMIFLMIRSGWQTDERYLYPVFGIVAFLAPQYFEFKLPIRKRRKILYAFTILLGFLFIFLVRLLLVHAARFLGLTLSEIVIHYAIDLFFLALVIAMLVLREKSSTVSVIFMVLLSLNLYFPLSMNLKNALRRENPNTVNNRFAPLALPDGTLFLCPETRIDLSPAMLDEMKIHPDPYEAAGVFNIFFDSRLPITAFQFIEEEYALTRDIIQSDADYIFLTTKEWQGILEDNPEFTLDRYNVVDEDNHWVVILENNERTFCQSGF